MKTSIRYAREREREIHTSLGSERSKLSLVILDNERQRKREQEKVIFKGDTKVSNL